jgi:hypothetical protein
MYEGGVRVMLMAQHPSIQAAAVLGTVVTNLDLAPTILEAAGLLDYGEQALDLDGHSWFSDTSMETVESRLCVVAEIDVQRSAVCADGLIKFISGAQEVGAYPDSAAAVQLYNLEADPTEQVNLAGGSSYETLVRALEAYVGCHDDDTAADGTGEACDPEGVAYAEPLRAVIADQSWEGDGGSVGDGGGSDSNTPCGTDLASAYTVAEGQRPAAGQDASSQISSNTEVATADDCAAACSGVPACQFFVHSVQKTSCRLYSAVEVTEVGQIFNAYTKVVCVDEEEEEGEEEEGSTDPTLPSGGSDTGEADETGAPTSAPTTSAPTDGADEPEAVVFDLGAALTVLLSAANVGPDQVDSFLEAVQALESEAVADALFVDGVLDMSLLFDNSEFNSILEAAGFDEETVTQITASAASFTLADLAGGAEDDDSGSYARLPMSLAVLGAAALAACAM